MRRLLPLLALLAVLALAGCGGGERAEQENSGCMTDGTADIAELDPDQTHRIVFETNKGSFTVELDLEAGPCAAASMAALARKSFFDGTRFHRIVPDFVIQGGDPTGTGTGGPGYKTVDTPPDDATYTRGVVAMAKAAHEARGTAGSQFFVVTADDAGLPPDYAVIGKVVEGLDVVQAIGELGGPDERPREPVVIESARVDSV